MPAGQDGEDGEGEEVGVLEGVPAGALLEGLALQCVDAAGRPVPASTPGKARGSSFCLLLFAACTPLITAKPNAASCTYCNIPNDLVAHAPQEVSAM
jgi:hypothetical protein